MRAGSLISRPIVWIGLLAAVVLGCQEELTAPAECPTLCPGEFEVRDTVLPALPAQDSSFEGYVLAGQGLGLRVSNQLPVSNDRAVVRFNPRPDSILVADTFRTYTIDSVALELSVIRRDTAVDGLKLFLYRLPATVDTGVTFTDVENALIPANLIDSFTVADSLVTARLRTVLSGADLAKVDIPPADSGKLAFGVRIEAPVPTGVLVGSVSSGSSAPLFLNYVHADIADTTLQRRTITVGTGFNTFVSETKPPLDPNLLTVGGVPSARALIRFDLPPALRDSAQILRASLEVVPTGPVPGLPNDSAIVVTREVLADFGGKSAVSSTRFVEATLFTGQTDTLRVEVVRLVQDWQVGNVPFAFMLALGPSDEGSSFTRATFGSTRSPAGQPRLRVTYLKRFPFERP